METTLSEKKLKGRKQIFLQNILYMLGTNANREIFSTAVPLQYL